MRMNTLCILRIVHGKNVYCDSTPYVGMTGKNGGLYHAYITVSQIYCIWAGIKPQAHTHLKVVLANFVVTIHICTHI